LGCVDTKSPPFSGRLATLSGISRKENDGRLKARPTEQTALGLLKAGVSRAIQTWSKL
jgi:hypothetical protein